VPMLIEWDNDVPSLDVLLAEARHADALVARHSALPGTAGVPPPSKAAKQEKAAKEERAGGTPSVPGRVHPGETRTVPALLELQRAMRAAMVDRDDSAAVAMLAEDVPADRLDIYRNTFISGATRALRLSFPAVHRLVGDDFFEGAAFAFIAQHPPRAACLDDYGAAFPQFLHDFPPAASLEYLGDIARLEWAVSRALHAPDTASLDLARLQALPPEDRARVCFVPHPALTLLRAGCPADAIWRGVLDGDDAVLAAIDLTSGPVSLLVERRAAGVEVSRVDPAAWRFAASLCEGRPLADIFAGSPQPDGDQGGTPALQPEVMLAEHLAAGRFVDFHLDHPAPCVTASAPSPECLP
jgi:hypothetical protein